MASAYPGGLDSFTNPVSTDLTNSVTVPHATQHSDLNDAVEAIQAELGIDPAGASATVVARLDLLAPKASPTFTGTVTLPNAVVNTATDAISASATQTQVAATAMTTTINRVTIVGTAGDAVKLPAAVAGKVVIVKNADAAEAVGVFPATGDAINAAAANAVYSLAALKGVLFFCAVAGTWDTILTA